MEINFKQNFQHKKLFTANFRIKYTFVSFTTFFFFTINITKNNKIGKLDITCVVNFNFLVLLKSPKCQRMKRIVGVRE